MSRHVRLRKICEEAFPRYRGMPEEDLDLVSFLRTVAIELFVQGVAFWQDEDAGAVRDALKEYDETGQISEYEHTRKAAQDR